MYKLIIQFLFKSDMWQIDVQILTITCKVEWLQKMDPLLLGCYTRFSCSLIKWNSQWAKITIPPLPYPPLIYRMTELTNKKSLVSNLNWRKFSWYPRIFYINSVGPWLSNQVMSRLTSAEVNICWTFHFLGFCLTC